MGKRYLIPIMIVVFLAFSVSASLAGSWNGWIYQNAYPTANTLLGVKFVTPKKGWAVGTFGTILYTEDGGMNWELQESGTGQDLRAVTFVNEKVGWAVGNGGVILHTEDGGKIWKPQGNATTSLYKIYFVNEQEGWVGGDRGTLLYTTDGGKNWEKKEIGTSMAIAGIFFINQTTGWILSGGKVYRTVDGGKNWNMSKLPPVKIPMPGYVKGPRPMILEEQTDHDWEGDIYFANEKKGWVVLNRWFVFNTEDGGKTWESKEVDNTVATMAFPDEKNGCASGSSILCTEDGGKTWKERLGARPGDSVVIEGFLINIQDMSFANKLEGWAVGGAGDQVGIADGQIMKTEDGGKSWRMISRSYPPWRRYFINDKVGWRIQNIFDIGKEKGRIVRTDDGGDTWTVQKEFDTNIDINRFFFIDSAKGWAVGRKRIHDFGTKYLNYFILHTTDGGKTWTMQFDEPAGKKDDIGDGLFDIYFINPDVGWVVGSKGRVLHTKDGGKIWERQKSGTKLRLRRVQFIDNKKGWAIGENVSERGSTAIIIHTDNGGKNWQIQWKKKTDWLGLRELQFINSNTGWVTMEINEYSGDCLLVQTIDGGKTWSEKEFKGIDHSQMLFLDKNRGAILTERKFVLITRDGGKTWEGRLNPLHRYPWHISEIFKEKDN
jgi:photosystem II stability/assembly factor-like uncharacterized protein